jgi:exodeoxyribonuclease VII large subunit
VKLGAALDAMSPLRVLSRGYTVSSDREGKVLKSVRDLRAGQEISVRFSDGFADCRVESITEGE